MSGLTLVRQSHVLASAPAQLKLLESGEVGTVPAFTTTLAQHQSEPLRSDDVLTLQVNVGKLCNQTCGHCHVDAGPGRREIMSRATMEECLTALDRSGIGTVDITGGAPEMIPGFRWFVSAIRKRGRHVMDRCNLTILTVPGYEDLSHFLASQQVEVVASLPCYVEENCDRQRGDGVFRKSIDGLRMLNAVGYGMPDSGLTLNLVYNPTGPSLPPEQSQLEDAYRAQLRSQFGIEFNRLYTITNMPISRFLADLFQAGQYDEYMQKLVAAFNPQSVAGLMCRTVLSVDWQGQLFDCDFNQMLELPLQAQLPRHIRDFDPAAFKNRLITTARHCYGCTAGAGSSCQGSLLMTSR
ncbi:MAG: arsenosugar biosynthesis radical SAM (seleno)protein ArsS [Planctomycetaceae bacterium]